MKNLISCSIIGLAALGCATSYDPGRLDGLYQERARIQETIQVIEAKHSVPSRDPEIQRQREEKHKAELADLKAKEDGDRQKADFEIQLLAKRDSEERAFLVSLTPEQRLQWMMHRDRMEQDRRRQEFVAEQLRLHAQLVKKAEDRQRLLELFEGTTRAGQNFSHNMKTSGELMLESQQPTINVNVRETK